MVQILVKLTIKYEEKAVKTALKVQTIHISVNDY